MEKPIDVFEDPIHKCCYILKYYHFHFQTCAAQSCVKFPYGRKTERWLPWTLFAVGCATEILKLDAICLKPSVSQGVRGVWECEECGSERSVGGVKSSVCAPSSSPFPLVFTPPPHFPTIHHSLMSPSLWFFNVLAISGASSICPALHAICNWSITATGVLHYDTNQSTAHEL